MVLHMDKIEKHEDTLGLVRVTHMSGRNGIQISYQRKLEDYKYFLSHLTQPRMSKSCNTVEHYQNFGWKYKYGAAFSQIEA